MRHRTCPSNSVETSMRTFAIAFWFAAAGMFIVGCRETPPPIPSPGGTHPPATPPTAEPGVPSAEHDPHDARASADVSASTTLTVVLGVDLATQRASLAERCVTDHYAERLSPSFLRLSCTVDGRPWPERRRWGVAEEGDTTRLAYVVRELEVARPWGVVVWPLLCAHARRALQVEPAEEHPTWLAWSIGGDEGDHAAVELEWQTQAGGEPDIMRVTVRHTELVARHLTDR